jgi:hypothetical protein
MMIRNYKYIIRYIALMIGGVGLFMIGFSCSKDPLDCFKSTGEIVTITRGLENFSAVLLKDNIDVTFKRVSTIDSIKIEITGGKNLLDKISSGNDVSYQYFLPEVIRDPITGDTIDFIPAVNKEYTRLVIENKNTCNEFRSYKTPISAKVFYFQLENLEYRSNGRVDCIEPIESNVFMINIYEGSNSINIKLHCQKSYLNFRYGTADLTVEGTSEISYIYQAGFGPINAINLVTNFTYLENRSSNDCYVNAINTLGVTINNTGNVYYTGNPSLETYGTGPGRLLPWP